MLCCAFAGLVFTKFIRMEDAMMANMLERMTFVIQLKRNDGE